MNSVWVRLSQKQHVTLEAEETWTEAGPKGSSGPIVLSGPGTTPLPQNGTRLRQQLSFSFSLCSCVQLLDGGVAEQ